MRKRENTMTSWKVEIELDGGWFRVATFIARHVAELSAKEWAGRNPGRMFRVTAAETA